MVMYFVTKYIVYILTFGIHPIIGGNNVKKLENVTDVTNYLRP